MYWFGMYLDLVTLTYISCSSDFYTFYINVPLSLGCIIWKVSAEDIAIRGNGTGLEYMCPTRHFVYIFFNPVFQLSTAKNEINLINNQILIVAPVTFAPAGAKTPSAEFLNYLSLDRLGWGVRYPDLGSLPLLGWKYPGLGSLTPTPGNLANSDLKSYLIILNLKF